MFGTTPSPAQKRWHDLLAQVIGCVCCAADGHGFNSYVSIHHIDGRTKPDAHWLVLPLCEPHHQDNGAALAVHPHKRRWEAHYGAQEQVLKGIAEELLRLGHDVPARVLELAGLEIAA